MTLLHKWEDQVGRDHRAHFVWQIHLTPLFLWQSHRNEKIQDDFNDRVPVSLRKPDSHPALASDKAESLCNLARMYTFGVSRSVKTSGS